MVSHIFMVNSEGLARRIKAKEVVKKDRKVLKIGQKSDRIKQNVNNLIKFAEEIAENGVNYKNESKNVSILER